MGRMERGGGLGQTGGIPDGGLCLLRCPRQQCVIELSHGRRDPSMSQTPNIQPLMFLQ